MDRKNIFIIVIIVFFAILIAGIATWWMSTKNTPSTDTTKITNYSKVMKNLPREVEENFERSVFGIIKINNPSIDPTTIKDVAIRESSYEQKTHLTGQYSGSFIVDIPSIRQSYKITYKHSNQNDGFDSGYPLVPSCVSDDERIYEPFNCKNPQYADEPENPLMKDFPYKSSFYTIDNYGEKTIIIKIALSYSQDTDKFFREYAASARSWLVSRGFNLDDYTLEYRDMRNNILTIAL